MLPVPSYEIQLYNQEPEFMEEDLHYLESKVMVALWSL